MYASKNNLICIKLDNIIQK
jgi:hypothetical protein